MMEAPSQRSLLLYTAHQNLTDAFIRNPFYSQFQIEIDYVHEFIQQNEGLKRLLVDLKKM